MLPDVLQVNVVSRSEEVQSYVNTMPTEERHDREDDITRRNAQQFKHIIWRRNLQGALQGANQPPPSRFQERAGPDVINILAGRFTWAVRPTHDMTSKQTKI